MSKKKRMQYRGPSRDIQSNPWLRLVHGRRYDLEIHEMSSGKVRVRVSEDYETARITYGNKDEFKADWI